jgi:hypothetical protein
VQLWPEHCDLAFDALTRSGRVTLGVLPGDAEYDEPYLYVSPWNGVRPGHATFWDASFGAVPAQSGLTEDPPDLSQAFFVSALRLLG